MSIDSYRRIAKAPAQVLPEVLELFSTTAAQVCEGQQYDMDYEALPYLTMEDYIKMIGLKTAVLLACSAKTGAVIAGADSEICDMLYDFCYRIGIAFQIQDDLLDIEGDAASLGKATGMDAERGKMTWPALYGVQRAHAMADALWTQAIASLEEFGNRAAYLRAFVQNLRARRA